MMLWECDCGHLRLCDPLAGDDWPDGVLRAVGPDCPYCDCPMTAADDAEGWSGVCECDCCSSREP